MIIRNLTNKSTPSLFVTAHSGRRSRTEPGRDQDLGAAGLSG
ncbi:hypothetical protein SMD44_p10074 (plasmid) [Streptomyces alboflavus]|uniref:Uncharacterized protein n=1 Tax=Streptomyces alboflavus TaxID=67267 RepID=A0A291W3U4_9ACTN|nr:hypothetical protein [Streptomyces alboflavus]ATM24573.1 hypothetical protein SMD44_p10074 [Streptomyces alboflavus]